jgi:hypothetical protein
MRCLVVIAELRHTRCNPDYKAMEGFGMTRKAVTPRVFALLLASWLTAGG